MPVCPIGWAVRLRHMIGLLNHLTIYLENRNMEVIGEIWSFNQHLTTNKGVKSVQTHNVLISHGRKSNTTS